MNADKIRAALRCGEPGCPCGQPGGNVHCPSHEDNNPSLSVSERNGIVLVKCHAGCSQDQVIDALKEKGVWQTRNIAKYGENKSIGNPRNRATVGTKANDKGKLAVAPPVQPLCNRATALTLAELSAVKKIPLEFLQKCGLSDLKHQGTVRVKIPYMNQAGEVAAVRFRLSLTGAERFSWRKGDRVLLYGLWRLKEAREKGWCLLVEGESDSWTCWLHDIPALGLPGKSTFRPEWAEHLQGLEIFLWQEPDAPELPLKLVKFLPGLMVIPAPPEFKDLSAAHLKGENLPALVERLKAQAVPAAVLAKEAQDARVKELRKAARPVLEAPDPLTLVKHQVKALGYGGDPTPAIITYLAATSRLLQMRHGAMPVHLLLVGQASAGKSYTLQTVLKLLPPEAYHTIPAGSPRVVIYDEAELQHRAVIFGESDSLPAGEDNPAASAIRNLLQDHHLHYDVTIKNPDTGDYAVKKVVKPGPTVLITTSTRRLGHQLDTRLFSLEADDNPGHLQSALSTQAALETTEAGEPDASLISFQAYLQILAPWRVVVPFAPDLAREIGKQAMAPRILRDFARLLSLIKAVAVMRHQHRHRDVKGKIIATLEDYETIYHLVAQMYEITVSGASESTREAVQTAGDIGEGATVADIAQHLGINKSTALRRVRVAIRHGWLVNTETRKGHPASLKLGDPLPERIGLPDLERLHGCTVAEGATGGATAKPVEIVTEKVSGCTVARETDGLYPPTQYEDVVI